VPPVTVPVVVGLPVSGLGRAGVEFGNCPYAESWNKNTNERKLRDQRTLFFIL
jgi:hypothetical protein